MAVAEPVKARTWQHLPTKVGINSRKPKMQKKSSESTI
jgi:hypothetical protein